MAKLVSVNDYEEFAKRRLSKVNFDFFISGAGGQRSLEWNKTSFSKYRIRPRYMRKVSKRIISTTILGKPVAIPIGIAPTAFHKLAHPSGEGASARAAQAMETIHILSSHSNSSIEEVSAAAPNARKWMQIYVFQNREITKDIIKTAESNGYEAIVLTVDFALFGLRLVNQRNQFMLPPNLSSGILKKYRDNKMLQDFIGFSDADAEWDYIKWLKTITDLPIVAKGILTAEDAIFAADAGVSAILVSNHGARQLDSLPATIEALPEIAKAVGDRVEVYMDGGIRDGTDIFKALGLGAKMVFVGRPIIWGLTNKGEEGAIHVLNILKTELDNAMGISGCSSLSDIKNIVVHESFYHKL